MDSGRRARAGPEWQEHQNLTGGGLSEPSVAVNSAIGFSPENTVFAQSTVGNVRSDRLKARTASI